jgi:phosphate transport system permease protein
MSKISPELIAKRYRAEKRFRIYGMAAIAVTASFLLFLLVDLTLKAHPALFEHRLSVTVTPDKVAFADPAKADYAKLAKQTLSDLMPQVKDRAERKALLKLLSSGAADDLREKLMANPALIGTAVATDLLLSDGADQYLKGYVTQVRRTPGDASLSLAKSGEEWTANAAGLAEGTIIKAAGGALVIGAAGTAEVILSPQGDGPFMLQADEWQRVEFAVPASERGMDDRQILLLEILQDKGVVEKGLAWRFFAQGDSREAELAGIKGALFGSIMTVLLTLVTCLPIGVGAAVYLEEFAPKNRLTGFIEVNINNLAAVPSIIFGLLGLAVFLGTLGLPRSTPIVGGLVLALLVLPTIIIASRASLRSVPPSIKEAALGVGASHQQAVFHHILPMAIPGILTGTILGVARALGETAPLLMIGMVAFIADVPESFSDSAAVLPVQVFLWSDLPEAAFRSKTALAILVLLSVLFLLNATAIYLRRRFERRW